MSVNNKIQLNSKSIKFWKLSAQNTFWCLIGCSIGDFGTIYFFQISNFQWNVMAIMILAIINGILTSIILETIILLKQMKFYHALKTALGMSLISMLSMEITMNVLDVLITGGAYLNFYIIPLLLFSGFIVAWPYNYWRLKKYNVLCH